MIQTQNTSLLEDLLADFGADGATFKVELPNGRSFEFRRVASYGEIQGYKRAAREFAKSLKDKKAKPESWRPYIEEISDDDAAAVYVISEYSVAPKFEQLDVLFLAKETPWLVEYLITQIQANQMRIISRASVDGIEAGKADSPPTDSTP